MTGTTLATIPARAQDRPRLDRLTIAGMGVCAVAAAVASAAALAGLAQATGWAGPTRWLLPASVDVLAAVAVRVWLDSSAPSAARRFGRTVTLAAVAVSMCGNAAGHLVTASAVGVSWPLIVTVGALPAAALGTVVHLHALRTGPVPDRRSGSEPEPQPEATAPVPAVPPGSPVPPVPDQPEPAEEPAQVVPHVQHEPSVPVRDETGREPVPVRPTAATGADGTAARPTDLDRLRDAIAAGQLPAKPTARAVRDHLKIGHRYASAAAAALTTSD